ncbi:hypothetical protein ACJ41O_012947 [Fusarium nematophilum]
MASSAPRDPLPERRDDPEVIDRQAAKLVDLIRKSEHFIVFTGAGVSTSADFRAVATYEKTVRDHRTGRKCTRCGGVLHDSIINFGEDLPAEAFQLATDHAVKADLCLVLGSSLTVTPASGIPQISGLKRSAKLVICNLQTTPFDRQSYMHIFSEADSLMTRVMEGLGFSIPSFILKRRLVIKTETAENDQGSVTLSGVDVDGTPVSYLQTVKLEDSRRTLRSEPFTFSFREGLGPGMELKFNLEFMGHYNEPNLIVEYRVPDELNRETTYDLHYDPMTGEWMTMGG